MLARPEWNQDDPVRDPLVLFPVLVQVPSRVVSDASQDIDDQIDPASVLKVNKCSSTQIRKSCAVECSQWTLYIEKADPLSGKPPFL